MRVLAEIVLALATLCFGGLWWQVVKRRRFLLSAVHDHACLEELVNPETLAFPPSRLLPYLRGGRADLRFADVDALRTADRRSQGAVRWLSLFALAAVGVASLYLGYRYLAFNGLLFATLSFLPVSASARANALEHILTLALILDRWHGENPAECDKFLASAKSLAELRIVMGHVWDLDATAEGPLRDEDVPF